jgi:hypothetical protein
MKRLERLRDEFGKEYPIQPSPRTTEVILVELQEAADKGKFYSFCLLQLEYKARTGHYWKL